MPRVPPHLPNLDAPRARSEYFGRRARAEYCRAERPVGLNGSSVPRTDASYDGALRFGAHPSVHRTGLSPSWSRKEQPDLDVIHSARFIGFRTTSGIGDFSGLRTDAASALSEEPGRSKARHPMPVGTADAFSPQWTNQPTSKSEWCGRRFPLAAQYLFERRVRSSMVAGECRTPSWTNDDMDSSLHSSCNGRRPTIWPPSRCPAATVRRAWRRRLGSTSRR
jgi:hypothetical protein